MLEVLHVCSQELRIGFESPQTLAASLEDLSLI